MISLCYHVPAPLAGQFKEGLLVIRSHDAGELLESAEAIGLERISYLQLMSTQFDPQIFTRNFASVPVEIALEGVEKAFPLLYKFSELPKKQATTVVLPVVSGVAKVVKVAAALHFAVRLQVSPSQEPPLNELYDSLKLYLHATVVREPIEFFHSLVLSFYHKEPTSVWKIQKEDPAHHRYVGDDGKLRVSERFSNVMLSEPPETFLLRRKATLLSNGGECSHCSFLDRCLGYFKMLTREYPCEGIKFLFQMMSDSANQLREDYPIKRLEPSGDLR
jgi:hypothetical protein